MPRDESCVYSLSAIPLPTVAPEYDTDRNIINKPDPSRALLWSGSFLPQRGDKVRINFNQLGTGTVVAYFTEHGWLGVHVKLDKPPAWHRKQNAGREFSDQALVFGAEIHPHPNKEADQ